MSSGSASEHRAIDRVRKNLENEGYIVVGEPPQSEIPFDTGGYRPDLLARKSGSNLIVEVRSKARPADLHALRKTADAAAAHGWRFVIYNVEDEADTGTTEDVQIYSFDDLLPLASRVEAAFNAGLAEAAVMFAWNIFIVACRIRAKQHQLSSEPASDRALIKTLYSAGLLSGAEMEVALEFQNTRNWVTHAVASSIGQAAARSYWDFALNCIARWRKEVSSQS